MNDYKKFLKINDKKDDREIKEVFIKLMKEEKIIKR